LKTVVFRAFVIKSGLYRGRQIAIETTVFNTL
jgi:hypothetical protein